MRRLIYAPTIHTSADIGSLAKDVTDRGIADLGERLWEDYRKVVDSFWDVIARYFDSVPVSKMKIYQDGMVAEGEIGQKIVEETANAGSKNYELVSRLLKRGAVLIKTEDFKMVKAERDRLLKITQAKGTVRKLAGFLKYRLTRDPLLDRRDRFIARRIDETLNDGEEGIIFIGAYHNIKKRLPKDVQVTEIKDASKVREYQKLLPFYDKNKERFEELGRYLISEIGLPYYKIK